MQRALHCKQCWASIVRFLPLHRSFVPNTVAFVRRSTTISVSVVSFCLPTACRPPVLSLNILIHTEADVESRHLCSDPTIVVRIIRTKTVIYYLYTSSVDACIKHDYARS